MIPLNEAHFCGIPSQSSIYGLTSLFTDEGSHKVLVASSKRKVYCIEYSKNPQRVIFSSREVQFTYIPGGAEIISVDAFNQACHIHDFVVGITFIKSDNMGKQTKYFNIYSDWEPSKECDLDNIAQGCLSISLDFTPFQLTHTNLYVTNAKETVWLLSGSDCKVHLYREDKERQTYYEDQTELYFPEFKDLSSIVMWMDFVSTPSERVTAIGCKDGTVTITYSKHNLGADVQKWEIQHDGPISSVKLFRDSGTLNGDGEEIQEGIHLLVGNTLELTVVYRDVLRNGPSLTSQCLLPSSNKFDCVTCCLVTDIDMDGSNEILMGTYGQQLLGYKWETEEENKGSYALFYQQMFPYPVLALRYIDIIGDGINELFVMTTKGLHIFQHDLDAAMHLCESRVKLLLEKLTKEKLMSFLTIEE